MKRVTVVIRWLFALLLALGLLTTTPLDVSARGGSRYGGGWSGSNSSRSLLGGQYRSTPSPPRNSIKCEGCPRDNTGKIKRDHQAVDQFKRTNPTPPGCHQCEVDHIVR